MGCNVEARYRSLGGLVTREQRVFLRGALAAESLMAFVAEPAAG
jgi:hypothetical protein